MNDEGEAMTQLAELKRRLLENPDRHLPPAPVIRPVPAQGRVAAIDTEALGHAVVALGGGRLHAQRDAQA